MTESGDDTSCMFAGPLVGTLAFPNHVNVFMRTMEGDVLYIDPQHKTHYVTENWIALDGVDASKVAILLSGASTHLVREAIDRLEGTDSDGAGKGAAGGGGRSRGGGKKRSGGGGGGGGKRPK